MITVIAAIIRQKEKILICQRGPGGNCAHLWEFPGGKLEAGESHSQCLVRECMEELNLTLCVGRLYDHVRYSYDGCAFSFYFYEAQIIGGAMQKRVHAQILWEDPRRLTKYPFCPADEDVVRRLATCAG